METNTRPLWASPGGPGLRQPDLGEPRPTEQVHACVQLQQPACQALQREVSPGWHGPGAASREVPQAEGLGDLSPGPRVRLTAGDPVLGLFGLWASARCRRLDGEKQETSKGPPSSDHLRAPLFPRIRAFSPSLRPREGPPSQGSSMWLYADYIISPRLQPSVCPAAKWGYNTWLPR